MELNKIIRDSLDFKIVIVAIFYYLSAQIGILLAFPETKFVPLWPPAGLALALVVLTGYRTWPAITMGSLIANAIVFLNNELVFSIGTISALTFIAVGNTLEALLGYYLIKNFIKKENPFNKTNDVFKFLIITLIICLIGALANTTGLWLNDMLAADKIVGNIGSCWMGDVVSVLVLTPFILSWIEPFKTSFSRKRNIEISIFAILLALIIYLLRVDYISYTIEKSFPFLIIPFLLWLGFRFNLQTASFGVLIVCFLSILFTVSGLGPFVLETESNSLLILQIFLGIISISTIILSATVRERMEAQVALKSLNETLEARIIDRTKELNEEITERKKIEEKIKVSNQKLRKANVELDNFVYSVSHDLRAPIASVLGLVNLALKESDIVMVKKYLDMVAKSAEQQDNFIKDILDLSRNSRLGVKKEEVQFENMIEEIFDQLKFISKNKKIKRVIDINQEKPFYNDQRRLKVIFNNLISNSIRYSNGRAPEIKIGVDVTNGSARIAVQDNGVGIEKEHLKNVFKMFYRANENNSGSGLGLYIVKETVDKLGGSIKLESKLDVGTKVTMEIPEGA